MVLIKQHGCRNRFILLLVSLMLLSPASFAQPDIEVISILNNRAMLKINGRIQVLSVGQSVDGLQLLEAAGSDVKLKSGQTVYHYNRQAGMQTTLLKQESSTVKITQTGNGMYFTHGVINQLPVRFVVDTGATMVTISSALAQSLGINYKRDGQLAAVSTAAQVMHAYRVLFDDVAIGHIRLQRVQGIVLEGNMPVTPLLGMSFLSRVKFQYQGQTLVINE